MNSLYVDSRTDEERKQDAEAYKNSITTVSHSGDTTLIVNLSDFNHSVGTMPGKLDTLKLKQAKNSDICEQKG